MGDETKTEYQLFNDKLDEMDASIKSIADELADAVAGTPAGALSAGDSDRLLQRISAQSDKLKALIVPPLPAQTNPPATGDTGTGDTGTGDTQPPVGTEIPPEKATAE